MSNDSLTIYAQLGKRIAYLRAEKKLSQLQLSLSAKISKNYLSDLENGRRNPSLEILNRLAKALDVPLEELFRGVVELDQLL
ncbi:MAG: anaerobic benzoate catabolism transcriptional regulator [Tenericutes bacterium ADurb.BinA155]|jgi:transcriptional regulator with XRE-family HTH domain|nr:MAG: anaerobic benzoate catabolism transcriptional regulator [Tenericutes bacterium ADurb.BinA155]